MTGLAIFTYLNLYTNYSTPYSYFTYNLNQLINQSIDHVDHKSVLYTDIS